VLRHKHPNISNKGTFRTSKITKGKQEQISDSGDRKIKVIVKNVSQLPPIHT